MKKFFAESCSVRYKDLLRAKKFFGVIGTLNMDNSKTIGMYSMGECHGCTGYTAMISVSGVILPFSHRGKHIQSFN